MAEVTSYRPGTPAWIDLATSDPEGARAFYGALFGWDFEIGPAETGHYTMCLLRGHRVAGMVGDPAREGVPTAWATYMATDDADTVAKRVEEAGGSLMIGPLDIAGEGRLVVGTDSGGAVFGAWQAGAHVGATLVDEPGAVTWSELATRDLAAAQRFYSHVFGYTWEAVPTGEGRPAYRTFAVEGRLAGGALQMTDDWPAETVPHWMPYFGVANSDAAAVSAERLGGAVQVPPTDSAYGRFTVLRDPQGGVFTAMRAEPPPER